MIMKRRSTLLTGKVELAIVDLMPLTHWLATKHGYDSEGKAQSPPPYCINPITVWREGLSKQQAP